MSQHSANLRMPSTTVASLLGLTVSGRRVKCFNASSHKNKSDKTPSLVLYPERSGYHCFGCGVHGDAIDLVRRVRGIGFTAAVQWLESQATSHSSGPTPVFPVAATPLSAAISPSVSRTASHTVSPGVEPRFPDASAIEVYTALYQCCFQLSDHSPAGQYLCDRGIDRDLATRMHAVERGASNDLWAELFALFPGDRLKSAGLVTPRGAFLLAHHPLVFFVVHNDQPVYLFARDITGQADAKELSLSGLSCPVPYHVEVLASQPSQVVLCEGAIDTISATQLGYTAIGIPGATGFRESWFALFRHVPRVTIAFDADDAGKRHAIELRTQFRKRGIVAEAIHPARHHDWNELLTQQNS